jgi:hypothetical protein
VSMFPNIRDRNRPDFRPGSGRCSACRRFLHGFNGWGRRLLLGGIGFWASLSAVLAQEDGADPEEIRRQLDQVLQQPEFDRLRLELEPLNRPTVTWFDRFIEWLQSLSPDWNLGPVGSGMVEFLKWLPVIVGAILVSLIVWLIIKAVNNWRARRIEQLNKLPSLNVPIGSTPPGEIPADEYLRRARLAAANGVWSEAMAQLLLGTLSATERHGLIRFRKGLTYRDYRRVLRRVPQGWEPFQHLVGLYLPVGFGRRPATAAMFEEALRDYEQCISALAIAIEGRGAGAGTGPTVETKESTTTTVTS